MLHKLLSLRRSTCQEQCQQKFHEFFSKSYVSDVSNVLRQRWNFIRKGARCAINKVVTNLCPRLYRTAESSLAEQEEPGGQLNSRAGPVEFSAETQSEPGRESRSGPAGPAQSCSASIVCSVVSAQQPALGQLRTRNSSCSSSTAFPLRVPITSLLTPRANF